MSRRQLLQAPCAGYYPGSDLTLAGDCSGLVLGSAQECQAACASTAGCVAWSFAAPDGAKCSGSCFLKSAVPATCVTDARFTSGTTAATPPPAPPAPPAPPTTPATPPPPTTPAPPAGLGAASVNPLSGGSCSDKDAVLSLHNQYRARHEGTAPLSWSPELAAGAQGYANTLASSQSCNLVHSSGATRNGAGENLYGICTSWRCLCIN